MTWLNWSLKLHSGLRSIPHLILTHNKQVLVQLMLISFVWLYMLKCDVYAQLLADQTQKYFWVFYMFLKVILYFHALNFCSKCIFVLFFKNLSRGIFARSSRLRASTKRVQGKSKNLIFIQIVLRVFHDQALLAKWFLGKNWKNTSFIQRCFSRLSNPRKTRVFSFIRLMWQFFKTLYFPRTASLNPNFFSLKTPSYLSLFSAKSTSRYVFLNILFIFFLDYAKINLGF